VSQAQPKHAVSWVKSSIRTSEYAQLVAQGKTLEQKVSTRRHGESNRCNRANDVTHSRVEWPSTAPPSMGFVPDAILATDNETSVQTVLKTCMARNIPAAITVTEADVARRLKVGFRIASLPSGGLEAPMTPH
jgi:hypothetical protein